MASDYPNNADSVLRGLWGNLVSAAENGRSASNMWNALRQGANSWAASVLNVTNPTPPTDAAIAAKAQELIGHVTIQDMNRYTSLAGEYLRAKQNLHQLGTDLQINGNAIFSPPWATTVGNPAVPTRYRIRVLRDITVRGFTSIQRNEWSTYEISGPLTNVADALNQANTLFSQSDYNSRASINAILDYTIEAI
jgi:hypothetical protein